MNRKTLSIIIVIAVFVAILKIADVVFPDVEGPDPDKLPKVTQAPAVTNSIKDDTPFLPETTKVTTPAPIETTEAVTEVPACEGTVGNYFISLNGASICYSDEGNPILIVTYGFTNNSDEAESMSYADIIVTVYQKGIELDTAWPSDIPDDVSYDYSNYSRKVQPGTTIEAQNAYELSDVSSQVIIEIEELFNFSNNSNKLVFYLNF